MKVKPNLFLNMSPQTTEEGGLAFARNMKLDDDGNLVSDYGYKNISAMANYNIVGHIVGLENKIYFFCHTLVNNSYIDNIVEYDEVKETISVINTTWKYGGGEIDGCVNTNQSGEKILTIGEYLSYGSSIPLKHINLSFPTVEQSLYSQAPKCPTANLKLVDTYVKTIPNGVYVFFIRYKIRKGVYTNWFLCSKPIFGGTREQTITFQGGLKYINTHKDSAKSFVFQLNFVQIANIGSYSEFQLGFIITHDEATDARAWKHFNRSAFVTGTPNYHTPDPENPGQFLPDENLIYFDYENVEEANIDDLLETTYEIYNVRNVASFKNKLYISNYKETNFNEALPNINDYFKVQSTIIDRDSTQNIYNNVRLTLGDTDWNLDFYIKEDKCYTHATDQNQNQQTVSGLINAYLADNPLDNLLDVNISDFVKGETVEREHIIDIYYHGDTNEDPDIIYAKQLETNIDNNIIFGGNFVKTYNSTGYGWKDVGLDVVNQVVGENFRRIHNLANNPHPFYNNNLQIGFGLFGNDSQMVPTESKSAAKGNVVVINSTSLNSNAATAGNKWFDSSVRSIIASLVKSEIEHKSRLILGYAVIYSGTKEYIITLSNNVSKGVFQSNSYLGDNVLGYYYNIDYKNNSDNGVIKTAIKKEIKNLIKYNILGIDDNGNITLSIDNDYVKANNITFYFKACELSVEETELNNNSNEYYDVRFSATLKSTYYTCLCTYNIKNDIISITEPVNTGDAYNQQSVLMPYSHYDAYIHFVDEHNIITNGIKLNTQIVTGVLGPTDVVTKHILQYKLTGVPSSITSKYKSFFISINNIGDVVIETFDYNFVNGMHILNVIEADAMLYNLNDNITIMDDNGIIITRNAKYYSSGEGTPALAFGNCGFIGWYDNNNEPYNRNFYIIISRDNQNKENISLVKATPYLPLVPEIDTGWITVQDGFYGSYFCSIKKPSFYLSSQCYVSGNDVYAATRGTDIVLKDFDQYISSQDSPLYFIRSNFNLNYLSLTQDINDKIYRVGNVKQVKRVIDSLILSSIYELKPMYKDFTNKYFRKYDPNYKVYFDNTIRVSHVLSDETFNNSVFKFAATDYYNVPTDRGIIVNLFSIGNTIFVHTKDSFYKFDGNQTITANNSDIHLQESEPFTAGISQIFDSEYGYGGIDTKESGCITFDSYFFYDKSSNHIFAYGGNAQVQIIDGNIYKLLAYYKPSDCKTLHDELNCRVLFEFTSGRPEYKPQSVEYKTFTLSYNYKTKTFVSFHDLSLVNAFVGRHRAYSYRDGFIRLFETETNINTSSLVESMNINRIFGSATTACIIEFGSSIYKKQIAPFGIAIVTFPKESIRETINSIRYIADIQQEDHETQSTPVYDVLVNPQVTRTNPVINFYIVTDSCVSSLVNTNVDDTARPNSLLDYKGFKYDMGFWTSNFFRNNINKTNIYNYPHDYPNRGLDPDDNSLVYGRYFIIVFDFKADTPIKFEELFVNTEKY